MTLDPTSLREGYRKKFNQADSFWLWANRSDSLAMVLGVIAVFSGPEVSFGLAVASLLLLIVSTILKAWQASAKQTGEEGRRAYVIADGLGYELAGKRLTDLLEKLPAVENPDDSSEYFSNSEEPSLERVLRNTQESAFWTRHLAAASVTSEYVQICFMALCALLIFVGCVYLEEVETRLRVAQCAILVVAAMITRDNINRAFAFSQAKHDAAVLDERLEHEMLTTLSQKDQLALVALVLGDYSALTSGMPVLKNKLHAQKGDELNGLWEKRRKKADLARMAAKEKTATERVPDSNK